jgi:hypothetical protein
MKPIFLIFKLFNELSRPHNKLDKFIELQNLKLENETRLPKTKLSVKGKTINYEKPNEPETMTSFTYEYSKNWWQKKYGHFNEDLYKKFLDKRAPELYH